MKTKQLTEKERLEIIEKKVEIQKKRIEIQKEKFNIAESTERKKIGIDEKNMLITKIKELRIILGDYTIDDEKTIMGSEPMLKPIITSEEQKIVRRKLMQLIEQL